MVAATHAFHVHTVAVVLSRCGAACGVWDRHRGGPEGNAPGQPQFIGVGSVLPRPVR
jgi:hypothetical protein